MKAIVGAQRAVSEINRVLCASKKVGVALRAGLEAALKPGERVFPLAGSHP
jgi:hypothetical protein